MGKSNRFIVQLQYVNKPKNHKSHGFTLIEMLVIAPIALIVIAGLVSAMVVMISDSLVANSRSVAAYDIQDTLNQIERDTRVATGFMENFSFFSSPQGRDGSSAPFGYSTNNDLILTQQATSSSPYSGIRTLINYANQPNACNSDLSQNRELLTRIIYFTKTETDGTKTLWRRTIINPWNLNTTQDSNTVCTSPWQRSSCPVGSTTSNTPGATCQAIDQKMLNHITSFIPTFYMADGTLATNPTEAKTVEISISVSNKLAGYNVTQNSVIRVSRINDIAPMPFPSSPIISILNPTLSSYNNPILTSFQWMSSDALSYSVSTKVGTGPWSTPTTTFADNIQISSPPNTPVSIRVTGINDTGSSDVTEMSTTSPLFTNLNLEDSWVCYNSSTYYCPSFTITTAGVVVLRGLAKSGTGLIGVLPQGFRPNKSIIFGVMSGYNQFARVDVRANGEIYWVNSGNSDYMSLDSIRFMSSDFDSSLGWISLSLACPSGCTTPWTNYGGEWGDIKISKDNTGRSQIYGTLNTPVPYPPPNYSNILAISSSYRPPSGALDIFPAVSHLTSSDGYSSFSIETSTIKSRLNLGVDFRSINATFYSSSASVSWLSASLANNWVNYGGSYSDATYALAGDHLITLKGLIKNGTTSADTLLYTLPSGYRPTRRMIFLVNGWNGSNDIPVRIDILANGQVRLMSSGSDNDRLSLAGISFYQEQ